MTFLIAAAAAAPLWAVNPFISINPSTGTLGVTTFTETGSGFTPNGTITQNVIYPNGGLTVYHQTANGSGGFTNSWVLQSQAGQYTETDTDDTTGVKSNTITYWAYAGPTISGYSWNPATPTAGQNFSGTVTGTGFVAGGTQVYFCMVGGNCNQQPPAGVAVNSASSLTLTNVNLISAGTYNFYVQTSAGQSGRSGDFTVQAGQSAPQINSISPPNLAAQPNVNQTVTVNGSLFQSGLKVTVGFPGGGGTTLQGTQIQNVTAGSFQMLITLANAGSWTIQVINPDGTQSNVYPFSVAPQGNTSPTITSISPTSVVTSIFTLTIYGQSFDGGAVDQIYYGTQFVGSGVLQSRSDKQIVVQEDMRKATPGAYTVKVKNSDGTLSNGWPLTITASSGSGTGTLTANPSTCQVKPPATTCTVTLSWSTQNVTNAQIWVTDVTGADQSVASGLSGTSTLTWIQPLPQKYVFHLWDYSSGSRGTELANVSVSATTASTNPNTPAAGVDPQRDTPGSTFTIRGSGLAPGSATIYVQAQGGSAVAAGQATAAADGTLTFTYNTTAQTAVGTYSAWIVDSSGNKSSSASFTIYQPNPASIPTCQSNTTNSGCNGDPINTATGNYTYQRTDLTIPGHGLPFSFVRTYNSQDGTPGPLGAGWTHSYMASLTSTSSGSVTIRMPDGQMLVFDPAGTGYVSRFNGVYSTLQSPSAGTFVLTTKNQISYHFANNQLTAISDRNGNTIQLSYSGGNLTTITDTAGRQVSLQYDAAGHLVSLTDPIGRVLGFGYDSAGNLVSFTDARGGQYKYAYDGSHEMLNAIDPVGNQFLTNAYDSQGHVSAQSDGMGNQWTYAYDPNTLITTITDPKGNVSSHLHDSKFELLQATDTLGRNDQYQYDALGNRISVQDRNGNSSTYSYDTNGNVISTIDAMGHVQAAAYDGQSNPLSRSDALGNQSTFTYDSKGNLTASTDPLGNRTTFVSDSLGQLVSKTDAEQHTTHYSHDSYGNLTQVTDPLGNITKCGYDAVGRRTSVTDANGNTTSTAYDTNDNVITVTDALGNKTQYGYDADNNRVQMTDARNKTTKYAYDGNNNLLTTTDTLGNTITRTYDKLRNLASTTDQRGNKTQYTYDSENRLTAATDPIGNTIVYSYDAVGNRTRVTDPLGNAATYTYDPLSRLSAVKDALGDQTTTGYDAASHVINRTDAAGNVTSYAYDAAGRQISIRDAAGGVVAFQYDGVGNRTQITDTRGKNNRFNYDAMNRLLTISDPLGNVTRNQYDAAGNLTQVTDANGNTKTYKYDADRRQIQINYSTGGTIQFAYDANGNRTQMKDLIGTSTYGYDDLNRIQSYTDPLGANLGFSYDAASDRTAIQYPGGKSVQYTFDADNRIASVADWNGSTASYSYDAAGRLTAVNYSSGLKSQYQYDAVGQNTFIQHSTTATVLYSEATTWSPNGNPMSSSISGLNSPGLPSETDAYAYNDANELTASTYGSTSSDLNGNVIVQPGPQGPTIFSYDPNNRATTITGPTASATMKYFGDGKLGELDVAGTAHSYLIDPAASGNRILAELDAAASMQTAYVYGPRGMLSQTSGGQTYTYLHNLQGSTVALVDSAGSVKNNYRYGLFGSMLPASTQPLANLFAFLGAFSVPSVGPYSLMAHRLYDARQGRFTASDPVRFDMGTGTSSYVYAAQSPLGLIDPSGLFQFGDLFNINSSVYSFADNPSLLQGANLDVCNFSFTLITSTCKKAGLTDNDIAIVKGVQTVSLQAFTLGGSTALTGTVETAQTLLSGAGYVSDELTYGPQVVQLLQGKLSPQDQSTLLRNLSLEMLSVGTDQFISDYSKQVGLSAAQQLAAVVAQQVGLTAIGAGVNALPSPASTPPAGGQSTGTHK